MEKLLEGAIACAHEYWPPADASPEEAARIDARRKKVVYEGIIEWHQKLYDAIAAALPGYSMLDYTDDEEDAACVGYRILLHEGQDWLDRDSELMEALGGESYELYVYCSLIGPFFYLECLRTRYERVPEGERWEFFLEEPPDAALAERLRKLLRDAGFMELTTQDVTYPVHDLRSGFALPEESNLFTFLFEAIFTSSVGREYDVYLRKPYARGEA